jgi:hypothetical protein
MWSLLKTWWHTGTLGGPPFEVACRCGRVARGWRQRTHQVLRCGNCGAAVFVLGRSPFPESRVARPAVVPGIPSRRRRRLALAGLLTLTTAAALLVLLRLPSPVPQAPPATDAASCREQVVRGEKLLAAGDFEQAALELGAACDAWRRQPQLLNPDEARHLAQLWRQAALLADLSAEPLEDILRHAAGTAEGEWPLTFARRYKGKGLLLDLPDVRALPSHHFTHGYRLWVNDESAQLDLDDLELLHHLPLDPPQRVLFGARLAAVRHEVGWGWVVRLEPGSGVLLTHPDAVRLCCPALGDAEALALLGRQGAWLKSSAHGSPK